MNPWHSLKGRINWITGDAGYLGVNHGPVGIQFKCVTPGSFPNPKVQQNHPAFIEDLSRKTALYRIGRNPEMVGHTLFLLRDSASFVTGHSLVVDGGWTIW
jgi:NAD(P)-dependent dehydrogenase (short-subunit alcohol dehydrogenase family)